MDIEKILNNNVILTRDGKGKEIIAMGRGLAFKKKVGESVEESNVDKIYRLENNELSHKFQELLLDLPIEYMKIADDIIDQADKDLEKNLNESIYISLADHIRAAVERVKSGIVIQNVLLWDIKRFFPKEFTIGLRAVEKIQEKYEIELPEAEAGFIAFHLVNAQLDHDEMDNMYDLTKIMQDIMNIVQYYFKISFDEESVYFYRFATHLRFFVARMTTNTHYTDETDDELLEMVRTKYHNAYECVMRIAFFLEEKYRYKMSNDESLYLTIHIARLVQKNS